MKNRFSGLMRLLVREFKQKRRILVQQNKLMERLIAILEGQAHLPMGKGRGFVFLDSDDDPKLEPSFDESGTEKQAIEEWREVLERNDIAPEDIFE